jgi:predicted Na+-dependent transporter
VVLTGSNAQIQCGSGTEVIDQLKAANNSCGSGSSDPTAASCELFRKSLEDSCKGKRTCSISDLNHDCSGAALSAVCKDAGFDPIVALSAVIIAVIVLSMGVTITVADAKRAVGTPKAMIIGWCSQFGFMPLMVFCLCHAFEFDNQTSVGAMLVGMAPGGSTSNLLTHWARGSVALSVAMSAASTICAFFMIPLLLTIYVQTTFTDQSFKLPFVNIIFALLLIVVFAGLGLCIRETNTTKKIGGRFIWQWVELIGGVLGGLFLLAALVTGILQNTELLNFKQLWKEHVMAALVQPLGCAFGYIVSTWTGLSDRDRRAVCMETGVQNVALAIALCALSFKGCERENTLLLPLLCALWYVVNSAWITLFLRSRPVVQVELSVSKTNEEADDVEAPADEQASASLPSLSTKEIESQLSL